MPKAVSITAWGCVLIIGILILACGRPAAQISGVVVDVRAHSLLKFESIDVRDTEDTIWHFISEDFKPKSNVHSFTPSHVREHMLLGLPITVWYRQDKDGQLLIIVVQD